MLIIPQGSSFGNTLKERKYKLMGNFYKDFFNTNRFSREAMPLSSELCSTLDGFSVMGASDETRAFREKTKPDSNKFIDSLSEEQRALYEKYEETRADEYTIEVTEYFNRGMCIGMRLALELLGGGHIG